MGTEIFTERSTVRDVLDKPAFSGFGRLLFPVDLPVQADWKLGEVADHFPWYSCIRPQRTVSIINELSGKASYGEMFFYDIYTDEEKKRDARKRDTGLFFFRGRRGARTAICNAGGGFMYVAALQDSLPHAQALARKGFNAFALIYRPGWKTACEDLARAISFLWEHAAELQIDMRGYSLWGGSAGARMSAWLGSFGTENFGAPRCPRPGAVIMQYTGLDEVYGNEPPTYNCVGTRDGIADYRVMERRIAAIRARGQKAAIEVFPGLSHGFGLGEGTVADGWLERAAAFWQESLKKPGQ